jgi:soluble P-type ATPase
MLKIDIPGQNKLEIDHLLLDLNGTIAFDGKLITGVKEKLNELSKIVKIHVITADTFGGARDQLEGVSVTLAILPIGDQDQAKSSYLNQLGVNTTVAIGNGKNDRLMLRESAIGIAVLQEEGASVEALSAADVICKNINSALDLLSNPKRLVATLRI